MTTHRTRQEEADRNSEALDKLLPQYIQDNFAGQYALMRDGKVELILKGFHVAVMAGNRMFKDRLFSVEKITDAPIHLGFYSYFHPGS